MDRLYICITIHFWGKDITKWEKTPESSINSSRRYGFACWSVSEKSKRTQLTKTEGIPRVSAAKTGAAALFPSEIVCRTK